jgi:hypothetical protein
VRMWQRLQVGAIVGGPEPYCRVFATAGRQMAIRGEGDTIDARGIGSSSSSVCLSANPQCASNAKQWEVIHHLMNGDFPKGCLYTSLSERVNALWGCVGE